MDAKTKGWKWGVKQNFAQSQRTSSQDITNCKGDKSNFRALKTGQQQVTKISTSANGENWYHIPLNGRQWEPRITAVIFWPKIYNLSLIMDKHWTNPTGETF